jgi:hypothetical protein
MYENRRDSSPAKLSVNQSADPFDFLGGSGIPSESRNAGVAKFPAGPTNGHSMMSETLRNKLSGFPRSSSVDQIIAADRFIRVSSYVVC